MMYLMKLKMQVVFNNADLVREFYLCIKDDKCYKCTKAKAMKSHIEWEYERVHRGGSHYKCQYQFDADKTANLGRGRAWEVDIWV